jgi:Protein of unknown function (DUF3108)
VVPLSPLCSQRPRRPGSRVAVLGGTVFVALVALVALDAHQPPAAHAVEAPPAPQLTEPPRSRRRPFVPGERLEYAVSFGVVHVGHGSMELTAGDTVRGTPVYHATFSVRGGLSYFAVDDRIDSWFDTTASASLRFTQRIREGRYHAERAFEIIPERSVYVWRGDTAASVPNPLDDASFLYFLRTLSLDVGTRYEFHRYFRPEGNPIVLTVLRRERVTVPAGTFDAVVVQPIIKTKGIFSQRGRAEVWLRTDGGHEVVQMKSRLAFGSINLYLARISRPDSSSRE